MNQKRRQMALAGVAVLVVCFSLIFIGLFGSLEEVEVEPSPSSLDSSSAVVETPTPTPKQTNSPTPEPTPSPSPSSTPTPSPVATPKSTPEPVYEPETDPEILQVYEENQKEKEELENQKKPSQSITEEDKEQAQKPSQTPDSSSSSKPSATEKPKPTPSSSSKPNVTEKPKPTPTPEKRVWLSEVPFISQVGKYPTGCESVSAVMACQYAGISITPNTFIDKYLPKASFTYKNGNLVGYHPNDVFMGNPYTNNGFGCYAPCIEKAINKFLPDSCTMVNTTGKSLSSLCRTYIDKGVPVVMWATMYMVEPGKGATWILKDTGKTFQWISHEHCLVLTGYDSEYYYFNDPLDGQVKYKKNLVETRYKQMGSQSLVVYNDTMMEPEKTPAPESTPTPESSQPEGSQAVSSQIQSGAENDSHTS